MNARSFVTLFVAAGTMAAGGFSAYGAEEFKVVVRRMSTSGNLVTGKVLVNGAEIGVCYENDAKKIPVGTYDGALRVTSSKNFVQGPGGVLGMTGDFLLEVANVPGRTDILFHAGNLPEHSEGCIMGGPATTDPTTGKKIAPPTLRTLRLKFFNGEDNPTATPDKAIKITVE
jgi:hypothetical protein